MPLPTNDTARLKLNNRPRNDIENYIANHAMNKTTFPDICLPMQLENFHPKSIRSAAVSVLEVSLK